MGVCVCACEWVSVYLCHVHGTSARVTGVGVGVWCEWVRACVPSHYR